jgi:hypothetical protein
MNARPQTLREVPAGVASLADFGRSFRDWLHTLSRFSSRVQVAAAIREEPPLLTGRFADGGIADAYLAAYAELLAAKTGQASPDWAFDPRRVSSLPWFAEEPVGLRRLALIHSPLPFKRRNLFTRSVDLPLRLRAGRPWKSLSEKLHRNAERQRRFRERRRAELHKLRALAGV